MTTTSTRDRSSRPASSNEIVRSEPLFTVGERTALAGFLAGYSGLTRDAYTLDLRQYVSWCQQHGLHLFQARRVDIECFGRDMETRGRARPTIARRLCTITGFYRYAVEAELLNHSPAVHMRRPRLDYESHAIGLDRNEVGALLVAADLGPPSEHALISLQAINGLRISEALGADIEAPWSRTRPPDPDDPAQGGEGGDHSARAAHRARSTSRSANASTGRSSRARTANVWTGTAPAASSGASHAAPA